ncbi:hypothetical protein ACTA71_009851 [Dictyostelium dimigraforme]
MQITLPDHLQEYQTLASFFLTRLLFICNFEIKGSKQIKSNKKSTLSNVQIVIPVTLRELILQIFHDDLTTGGHFGFLKTYNKIFERFYWRGMIHDVKNYISTCKVCNASKRRYGPLPGFLIPMENGEYPFHTIGIDFLTATHEKFTTNVLVIIDYFTKWPEVFISTDQKAETVAMVLFYQIFMRFGAPKRIVSDRGTSFQDTLPITTKSSFYQIRQ